MKNPTSRFLIRMDCCFCESMTKTDTNNAKILPDRGKKNAISFKHTDREYFTLDTFKRDPHPLYTEKFVAPNVDLNIILY